MRRISAEELRELAGDIEIEVGRLRRLEGEIQRVQTEIQRDPNRADLFYENLAFKLHNFYTGCERIFRIIASELNGALPSDYDWHKRLLERMSLEREGRPAVLAAETARQLEEYLAFRHVVRNLYGYELDPERIERLLRHYHPVWQRVEADIQRFASWLRALALQLEKAE